MCTCRSPRGERLGPTKGAADKLAETISPSKGNTEDNAGSHRYGRGAADVSSGDDGC